MPSVHSSRTVAVDGADLHVELSGDPGAPPVLLLHGGLGSTDDFAAIVPLLASDHCLIGLDSRGHGRSTLGTVPLTYARLERDVVQVLDALGVEAPGMLGFSDGGIVGYRIAAHHPDRVAALVTIGADWDMPDDSTVRPILAGVTPATWRARSAQSEAAYLALNPEPDFDRFVTETVAMWLDRGGYPGDDIDAIACPLAIVRGADDPLTGHDLAVELQARAARAALYELAGAGHAVATTHPDAVAGIVRRTFGSA